MEEHQHHLDKNFFQPWRQIALVLMGYDFLTIVLSYFAALWVRFDCRFSLIPAEYFHIYQKTIVFYALCFVLINWLFRLYRSMWRFASYHELLHCCLASLVSIPVHFCIIHFMVGRMPYSYYFLGGLLQSFLLLVSRFSYRIGALEISRSLKRRKPVSGVARAMLIGAGEAGRIILRDLMTSHRVDIKVECIIDDDPNKWQRETEGVPIVGGREDILLNVKKYDISKIFFAIPTASPESRKEILNICNETGCELKVLPGVYQLVSDDMVKVSQMRDVDIEDLLGRKQIKVNMDEIFNQLSGKVVMITGGGGSIGSELSRQIAAHHPRQLIIFDIYENNAYDIEQELRRSCPGLNLTVLIGSVRDAGRIFQVFSEYRPEIVFHAAAHKHVPLMENSPCEAIKNNALGTYKTAFSAMMHGCRRFVLISTDKAVNPTNIMGASKRLCEMIVQVMNRVSHQHNYESLPFFHVHPMISDEEFQEYFDKARKLPPTEFVAVRFGNVLGSNGSVIPLFKKQIAAGGPVTVTHPDIIRYFMTIPEAVSLVLQAGTYAEGGEIFVLDMGEPVKIDTLARNLIKLSGFRPDIDIKIDYTGLRPGEKLYEEKLMAEEGLKKTPNHLIHIAQPLVIDDALFLKQLEKMAVCIYHNDNAIFQLVEQATGTYKHQK